MRTTLWTSGIAGALIAAAAVSSLAAQESLPPLPRPRARQPVDERAGSFREEARVERVVIDAHVTDNDGEPIRDLGVADFALKVDGKRVPIESVEWVSAGAPEAAAPKAGDIVWGEAPAIAEPVLAYPPGRVIVLFFQTDHEPVRIHGFLRMVAHADRLLETFLPTDRIAVVSFDSHLKLRQDFTDDLSKVRAAMIACLRTGEPERLQPGPFPSLARNFDYDAALDASTPERGLELVARALEPIPGGKSMLYFGWGLGTVGGLTGPVPAEKKDYRRALTSLSAARVNIFTLDVTDADYHTLEYRLEAVSEVTGGTYHKTHLFPDAAIDRVTRAISGRYVIVFVKPALRRGEHEVELKLVNRKGTISARRFYDD
ncbi:MAG TPA: VWA domain-containing protein [Thermoanaerobaculia bacterium]|nr:VWA domain-containing protein [Thermoanaerobaculia bacterium]